MPAHPVCLRTALATDCFRNAVLALIEDTPDDVTINCSPNKQTAVFVAMSALRACMEEFTSRSDFTDNDLQDFALIEEQACQVMRLLRTCLRLSPAAFANFREDYVRMQPA